MSAPSTSKTDEGSIPRSHLELTDNRRTLNISSDPGEGDAGGAAGGDVVTRGIPIWPIQSLLLLLFGFLEGFEEEKGRNKDGMRK